jgi:hypothetical protein
MDVEVTVTVYIWEARLLKTEGLQLKSLNVSLSFAF